MFSLPLKKAREEDLVFVRQIAFETWPVCYKDIISAQQIEYMLNYMYDLDELKTQYHKGVIFLLMIENDTPVGFIGFEKVNRGEQKALRVHKLYILPHHHKKSYGKTLLEAAIHFGKKYDIDFLELNVNKQNPAVSFYSKIGFEVAETMVLDIGNGYTMDDYVMVLKLGNTNIEQS